MRGIAARTCSRLLAEFLCNCRLASSPAVFFRVHVRHPYSSIDATATWKKLRFILSVRSDFHIIDSLLIGVHAEIDSSKIMYSSEPKYFNILAYTSVRNVYHVAEIVEERKKTSSGVDIYVLDSSLTLCIVSLRVCFERFVDERPM